MRCEKAIDVRKLDLHRVKQIAYTREHIDQGVILLPKPGGVKLAQQRETAAA